MVPMMVWYGAHWAFWQVGLMWAGMIVFWGLLIWGVYVLVSNATRRPGEGQHRGDARHILDERLARGEIDADEYRRLRNLIDSEQARTPAGAGRSQ